MKVDGVDEGNLVAVFLPDVLDLLDLRVERLRVGVDSPLNTPP